MATLMIRKLDENVKKRLRVQAARNGRSMEEEARLILAASLARRTPPADNVADAIRRIIEPIGGAELEPLPREPMCSPPKFK